jgi:hypothetical protein
MRGRAGPLKANVWGARTLQGKQTVLWLISGTTVTVNFLKKSMLRMGPATAACKKVDVKGLPWNCVVFLMKPQEGIGCSSAPWRRVPNGLEFWLQETILKIAPVSTRYLSLVFCQLGKSIWLWRGNE